MPKIATQDRGAHDGDKFADAGNRTQDEGERGRVSEAQK